MNTVTELFSYAEDHDIRMHVKDRDIVFDASENELTERFLKYAKKHKRQIIAIIMARDFGAAKQINIACRGLNIPPSATKSNFFVISVTVKGSSFLYIMGMKMLGETEFVRLRVGSSTCLLTQ